MSFTDEQLMAYADGELDEGARAEIAAALARDPALAARVQEHRAAREQLQAAFAPVLDEPIPDRLTAAIDAPARTRVVDLRDAREGKTRGRARWSWPEWAAIAASLLLGVLIGLTALESRLTFVERDGSLIAAGPLERALKEQLSDGEGEHRVALSFRSRNGAFCRAFISRDDLSGLACRGADGWNIHALAEAPARSAQYERASSALPAGVLAAIDQWIEGEPLTLEEEASAREKGW